MMTKPRTTAVRGVGWPGRTVARALRWLCLLLLLIPVCACAGPPALTIAAEPLTGACRPAGVQSGDGVQRAAQLALDGNAVFQAAFAPEDWSGRFERFAVLAGADGAASASPAAWDAGAILTGTADAPPRPAPARRQIYTAIVQADGGAETVPFEWDALSAAQRALLDTAPRLANERGRVDGLGERRLAFLRGERGDEGTLFRRRGGVLGDAVHSTPVFVGQGSGAGTGADYGDFYARSKLRRGVVYLGANDGMLHAFDARDGVELFAYVPDALFAGLNQLTSPAYVHRAYVDGPASAGEALVGTHWKTVLLSGMGGGAQGVFALDVSDPEHFAGGGGALWEFTDRDDAMMGNVTGLPQVAKVRVRHDSHGASYRYFAVVASGLNNYAADGHRSAAGNGALFLLALDKPAGAAWRLNDNYYRLVTPIAEPALANALGAPALVAGADGALRYAYAGDLQGNLWRFDFDANAPWPDAVGPGPGPHGAPLFVARDAAGRRQPIVQQPRVVYAPGGYMVLFGTGRLLEAADRAPAGFAPQSYYGIFDSLRDPAVLVDGRADLTPRVFSGDGNAAALGISGADRAADSKGWYVDFSGGAADGERSVASAALVGGQVIFHTVLPGRDACTPARGRRYMLDALSGLPVASATLADGAARAPPLGVLQPVAAATPVVLPAAAAQVDGAPPLSTSAPSGRGVRVVVNVNAGDGPRVSPAGVVPLRRRYGRLSWREVVNWRELHRAANK